MFGRDLPLHDEVDPLRSAGRMIEQPCQQRRRDPERWVGDDAVRLAWQVQAFDGGAYDLHAVREVGVVQPLAELLVPDGIRFDRPHRRPRPRQLERERADTGADVDDEYAVEWAELGDELVREMWVSEEVLTERPPSAIPLGPTAWARSASLGHGTSP